MVNNYMIYERLDDLEVYVASILAHSEEQAIQIARQMSERMRDADLFIQGSLFDCNQ